MATNMGNMTIVSCAILEIREKAVLCYFGDIDETRWVPKSVIEDDHDDLVEDENDGVDLHIATWFAEREGLT